MEDKNVEGSISGGGGGAEAGSRWNPTKEQISILEALYKQGIRTPSADQIQHITSRLKAYGHIEGKNVFYWFQNHKARQRQKQKQESLAYLNQYLHKATSSPPVFTPSSCSNVVCSPYYIPQSNGISYYPQYPKVPIPSGVKRKQRVDNKMKELGGGAGGAAAAVGYNQPYGIMQTGDMKEEFINKNTKNNTSDETLALFPLHPTGILNESSSDSSIPSSCPSNSSEQSGFGEGYGGQPFFDFFAQRGSF